MFTNADLDDINDRGNTPVHALGSSVARPRPNRPARPTLSLSAHSNRPILSLRRCLVGKGARLPRNGAAKRRSSSLSNNASKSRCVTLRPCRGSRIALRIQVNIGTSVLICGEKSLRGPMMFNLSSTAPTTAPAIEGDDKPTAPSPQPRTADEGRLICNSSLTNCASFYGLARRCLRQVFLPQEISKAFRRIAQFCSKMLGDRRKTP